MNLRTNSSVYIAVAALAILATVATAVSVFPSGSTNTTPGLTSASATSADGLRLTLQISGMAISHGGSVTVNVTETNVNSKPLNESTATKWPVVGLRMNACYASVYPFGVAVYEGHQTLGSIASAVRLNIYPLVPCPLLIRYISGYYFQAASSSAVVLPGNGTPLPMSAGVQVAGNYTTGETRTILTPGEYTVAAGDEWGSIVLLYFVVG